MESIDSIDLSNMTDLDLRLLRVFDALFAARSVTRAADLLGLSQPTVSIGLGQLRAHYCDPLFVQVSGGMMPTPFAEAMAPRLAQSLAEIRQISAARAMFEPATTSRCFRVAMSDASHLTLLPHLFAALRAEAPLVRIEACPIDASLAERLACGAADIAIGSIPGLGGGFYQRVLYDQSWVTLRRAHHPLRELSAQAYAAAEHVAVSHGTGHVLLEAALAQAGIEPLIALSLPGFLGLPSVLANSDLIATLPRHIGMALATQTALTVAHCPIPVPGFQVKLHWHARQHADPANAWLRDTAASALAHAG